MAPQTKSYEGEADECVSQKEETSNGIIMARGDAKSTLLELPSWDQMFYMTATGIGLPSFVLYVALHRDDNENDLYDQQQSGGLYWLPSATIAAAIVSIGPLLLAASLSIVTANPPIRSWKKFRYVMFYPFHNEPFFGKFGIILLAGTLVSIMPTFHFFHSFFVRDPQETAYNRIWGS